VGLRCFNASLLHLIPKEPGAPSGHPRPDILYEPPDFERKVMPTFSELAEQYANNIRTALQSDGFTRSSTLTESKVRISSTVETLRETAESINGLKLSDTGEPLSREQQLTIYRKIAALLEARESDSVYFAVKSASNDDFLELVDYIDDLIK